MTKAATDISFEEALTELEKIVKGLEGGASDLNASITSYERGMTLKKICEQKLKEAESRIEKITIADGKVTAEKISIE